VCVFAVCVRVHVRRRVCYTYLLHRLTFIRLCSFIFKFLFFASLVTRSLWAARRVSIDLPEE
jgi:hypothetical protein